MARDDHARQQDADAIIGLRSCNSLHGSDRTGGWMLGCLYRMRITDPGCTGCVDREKINRRKPGVKSWTKLWNANITTSAAVGAKPKKSASIVFAVTVLMRSEKRMLSVSMLPHLEKQCSALP